MRTYQSTEIGNVVVLGHAGCGKTSVIEAMLYRAGGSNRIGKIADGTTTSDYDAEEMKRSASARIVVLNQVAGNNISYPCTNHFDAASIIADDAVVEHNVVRRIIN